MPGYYDCITCGPLDMEYHDARDANDGCMMCIANGVCDNVARPAKKADGDCYWYGLNGHCDEWYLPDPEHRERNADELPRYIPPLAGQMGFDGSVVGSE